MSNQWSPEVAERGELRDDLEAIDPRFIPTFRRFPIEKYADILASGKAAVTTKRYETADDARRDLVAVTNALAYYQQFHPEMAPVEFGRRVWASAEDGRYRWAVMPERIYRHIKRAAR